MTKHIWTVELEEKWDYEDDYDGGEGTYTVAAKTYEEALKKAQGVAMKKSFFDALPEGDGKNHKVVETRLTSISRGNEIDA